MKTTKTVLSFYVLILPFLGYSQHLSPGDLSLKGYANILIEQQENEAFDLTKKLAKFRKDHKDLFEGKMVQFLPEDGLYVYFRYNDEQKIMVILNKSDEQREINLSQYAELLNAGARGRNIISGEKTILNEKLTIGAEKARKVAREVIGRLRDKVGY